MGIAIISVISLIILTMMLSIILSSYIRIDLLKIKSCLVELNPDDDEIKLERIKIIRDSITFKNLNVIKENLIILDKLIEEEELLRELRRNIKELKVEESKKLLEKIETMQKNF